MANILSALLSLSCLVSCAAIDDALTSESSAAAAVATNDPLLVNLLPHYNVMSLSQAWSITQGNPAIRIAVIDSGIIVHEDLDGSWNNTGRPDDGLNLDASDETLRFVPRLDLVDGAVFHGTHTSGIAVARQNTVGIAGVCPNCSLLPIRVPHEDVLKDLHWAILYAAGLEINEGTIVIPGTLQPRARVISMSLASTLDCTDQLRERVANAIRRALERNVVIVASAGNFNNNGPRDNPGPRAAAGTMFPANCKGVISVASVTRNSILANYSDFEATIAAPGGDDVANVARAEDYFGAFVGCAPPAGSDPNPVTTGILSTFGAPGTPNCYRYLHGTSMATPMVAGVVGLVLSREPGLTPAQVAQRLVTSASPLGDAACQANGKYVGCGAGVVNAYRALNPIVDATTADDATCGVNNGTPCMLDTRTLVTRAGSFQEIVTARGRLWTFDAADRPGFTNGVDLRDVPRYASGPCAFAALGEPCVFDTLTVWRNPSGSIDVESITAYGRYWNFNANGQPQAGNGNTLASVARYANGPCAFAFGQPCKFDSRTMSYYPDGTFLESITAYGRFWNFDANGLSLPLSGNALTTVSRYASGPCAFAPAGQPCTFDSRVLGRLQDGTFVESITAYGRYWNFDVDGNPWSGNAASIRSVGRWTTSNGGGALYVRHAYRYLLGRNPQASETRTRLGQLLNGAVTPSSINDQLLNTSEALVRRSPSNHVHLWLTRYWGRSANPVAGEPARWADEIRSGAKTAAAVQATFLDDPANGAVFDAFAFVTAAYRQILAREPTASELNGWVATLVGGATRTSVRNAFLNSAEFRTKPLAVLRQDRIAGLYLFSGATP